MLECSVFPALPIRILEVRPGGRALVLEGALLTVGCVALSPVPTLGVLSESHLLGPNYGRAELSFPLYATYWAS